jgi:hypothetical protein
MAPLPQRPAPGKSPVHGGVERRQARSLYRGEAADLYLAALSRRHGLAGVVLADEQGLPIAAAGCGAARERLSEHGALHAASDPRATSAPGPGPRSRRVPLGAGMASMTFLGQADVPWDAVARDLERILELGFDAAAPREDRGSGLG